MTRTRNGAQFGKRFWLQFETLEGRNLPSSAPAILTGGVIEAAASTSWDLIQIDRDAAAQTVAVAVNYHTTAFPASVVRGLRVTGLNGSDLLLLDTRLNLPVYVAADVGGKSFGGWLNSHPLHSQTATHHGQTNGRQHWVITAESLRRDWDFVPAAEAAGENSLSSVAVGLADSALNFTGRVGASFADGHLFHSLGGDTSLTLGSFTMTAAVHGTMLSSGLSMVQSGLAGSAHDFLLNPPFQGVDHKPG